MRMVYRLNNCFMRERVFGKFQRSLTLPAETDFENIKAEFNVGVFKRNIPKLESSKPKNFWFFMWSVTDSNMILSQ